MRRSTTTPRRRCARSVLPVPYQFARPHACVGARHAILRWRGASPPKQGVPQRDVRSHGLVRRRPPPLRLRWRRLVARRTRPGAAGQAIQDGTAGADWASAGRRHGSARERPCNQVPTATGGARAGVRTHVVLACSGRARAYCPFSRTPGGASTWAQGAPVAPPSRRRPVQPRGRLPPPPSDAAGRVSACRDQARQDPQPFPAIRAAVDPWCERGDAGGQLVRRRVRARAGRRAKPAV